MTGADIETDRAGAGTTGLDTPPELRLRDSTQQRDSTTQNSEASESDDHDDHDDYLAPLRGIANRPLTEHADAYTEVHARLQSALTDIDDAAG